MREYIIGKNWEHIFSFTQQQVEEFAQVTGDNNPIHLDEEYAKKSIFKKRVVHGALSNSIFSKVFGSIFPGEGSIYLSQETIFFKPMYVNVEYVAKFNILNVKNKKQLEIETIIKNTLTHEIQIKGKAKIIAP